MEKIPLSWTKASQQVLVTEWNQQFGWCRRVRHSDGILPRLSQKNGIKCHEKKALVLTSACREIGFNFIFIENAFTLKMNAN